jgi:ketosteroid isomerase-like protein
MISSGEISPGYGVEDGVALHYTGTELKYVVSSSPSAKAFYVRKSGFRVTEKEISPAYLGILNEARTNEIKEEKSEKQNRTDDSINVVKEYIKRINEHNVDAIVNMMSEDHTFVDSLGINTTGRENMRAAWDTYLTFFPDYTVLVKEIISKNGMVAVFGTAKGTLSEGGRLPDENKFEIPASWTAVVKDGKIAKWRVYADNGPVRKLIEKYSKTE